MSTIYENINTFNDEIYKSDLREKILNPMIVQHNNHSVDLNNHEARIDALEEGGVGGGAANFKDLQDVPDYIANKFLKVGLSGDLEWASVAGDVVGGPTTFIEMTDTPATYADAAGMFLQVNPEGNSIMFVDAPDGEGADLTEVESDIADLQASVTALEAIEPVDAYTKDESDAKYALKGEGGAGGGYDDTALTAKVDAVEADIADHETRIAAIEEGGAGAITSVNNSQVKFDWSADLLPTAGSTKTITEEQFLANSFFISATGSTTAPLHFELPEIVESNPTSTQTVGGRIWYFANAGGSDFTLKPKTSASNKVVSGTSVFTEAVIPSGYTASIMSCINGSFKHWVVMSCSASGMTGTV